MQRQPHPRPFGFGNDSFQKISDGSPHLFQRVGALVGQGRQVPELDSGFLGSHVARILAAGSAHQVVVETRPADAGAGIVGLLEVALHGAMRVPVVFDDRQPHLARRLDGGDHFLDLLIASRPPIDNVAAKPDHEVPQVEAAGFVTVHLLFETRFIPGDLRPAAEHPLDAQLPDAARGVHPRAAAVARRERDLGRVLSFKAGREHSTRGARRRCQSRNPGGLDQSSSRNSNLHDLFYPRTSPATSRTD